MRVSGLTIAGAFFLFIGVIEIGAVGFAGSAPIVGAIGSPGLWGILVGIALIALGTRKKGFSRHRSR